MSPDGGGGGGGGGGGTRLGGGWEVGGGGRGVWEERRHFEIGLEKAESHAGLVTLKKDFRGR